MKQPTVHVNIKYCTLSLTYQIPLDSSHMNDDGADRWWRNMKPCVVACYSICRFCVCAHSILLLVSILCALQYYRSTLESTRGVLRNLSHRYGFWIPLLRIDSRRKWRMYVIAIRLHARTAIRCFRLAIHHRREFRKYLQYQLKTA